MQLAACLCIGLLWGCTNSFVKRGSAAASLKAASSQQPQHLSVASFWYRLLTTWKFVLPQALNLLGSVCFAYLLGKARLSFVVPITNASSLLANAVTDWAIGEQVNLALAAPGALFLALGMYLCATTP